MRDQAVSLSVSDTGIGIPPSKFNEILDPFTQLAPAMRGDVTVESTVGVGSTFTFTLPRST